jgi:hypothetical protein
MEIDYKERYEALRQRFVDAVDELHLAQAKLEENPNACKIGQLRESKIFRQRAMLRNLNRRVRIQRLQLRKLNELERGLRPEEWAALKEEFAHELAEDQWDLDD